MSRGSIGVGDGGKNEEAIGVDGRDEGVNTRVNLYTVPIEAWSEAPSGAELNKDPERKLEEIEDGLRR